MTEQINIPDGLEVNAIAKFDNLVNQGEIFYEEATWKRVEDGNVITNFLISPALSKKPILSKNDPARGEDKGPARSPFVDPDPNFVLGSIGPDHTLIFNKFCVSRPMYLLHTNTFQFQTDNLNESDIAAIWTLLTSFKSPQMVIYNCGADAGASQGHKHLQMFPAPDPKDCVMFPENLILSHAEASCDYKMPFQNFVIGLELGIKAHEVFAKYELLLAATQNAMRKAGHNGLAYNVVLVRKWMAMIPRTHANDKGKAPANAAGMMGLVWAKDDSEVAEWEDLGIEKHLGYLGLHQEK